MTSPFATRSTLFEVVEHINAGRLTQAESICRAAVARNGDDVNMTALLGATLIKARKPAEAEQWLRRSTELAPGFAKPWSDLGRLLAETGRAREAIAALEKAVELAPGEEDAWFQLGRCRAQLGQGAEADAAFERSFALNPARKALALAAEHQRDGRWRDAETCYRDVLRAQPDDVNALRGLAACAAHAGRPAQAEQRLRRVVALAPDWVEARLDLGRLLKEQHRLEDAITELDHAVQLAPDHHQAHFLLGSVLAPAARTHDAVAAYRRVVELRPNHAAAWLGLGHTLKTAGQQAEAINAYRECIRLKPGNGETWWSLANLKTYRLDDDDIATIEAQLAAADAGEPLDTQSRVNFEFALAKAWEDRGEIERAWPLYRAGNERQREHESYDPVRTEVLNDTLIEVFDRDGFERRAGAGHDDPAPIFIVGLPRSGSTLLEQILCSHSQVEGTAELPYIGVISHRMGDGRADGTHYPQAIQDLDDDALAALGREYLALADIHRTQGRPRFVDKMPNNFPAIGLIHSILPNAKIIDARRYPVDACLSGYRQLFARGQSFTYDMADIGEYWLEYQRMMDHWHEVLPGRVLTVQYEDVVTDFDAQLERLLAYCELPFEPACARFWETDRPVRTASSEQVRTPLYTGSIHRWRRYAHHLDELLEVLAPVLPRYSRYEALGDG
ncbi:tetratricopeptide repeat protein [Marinihelvus fidelis]|uniref:Tetratricopeptide repeat protein n=1 Tax=Marinihelvus fidelis TaxID=2613842 RepID=A0A5N0TAF1_9GAMM|nr:tetratricopeptide repeat-containing sulfotransferase family protein [Marinihelvus fidelis]KAA9131668.1 tetratricopeptide repeat protein [Marinihelvus fidelis]